jgi:hypothetical protein
VTLGAPPYWQKLQGERIAGHLPGLILHTVEGFTYHREWTRDAEPALEFTGNVGDLELQGIDLITLDRDGRIQNLDVLMRPVNGVIALRDTIAGARKGGEPRPAPDGERECDPRHGPGARGPGESPRPATLDQEETPMKIVRAFVLGGAAAGAFALAAGAAGPEATQCLAAAKKSDTKQTIEICTKALKAEPENAAVKEALKTAKAADAATGTPPVGTSPGMGDTPGGD